MGVRRASRLTVALVLCAALAVAIDWGVGQLSLEKHRTTIEQELSAALGREVRLAGELRFDLLPQPALEATEVIVANPPGRASPDLLRIEGLRLVLALWPLLERRLQLVRLHVHGADLRLEAEAEGSHDLLPSFALLSGESSSPEGTLAIRIDRIDLDEIRVSWLDVASGDHDTLDVDALEIVTGEEDEPIQWSVRGSFRGGSFDFEGRGGTLAALMHPSGPWPLSLEGRVGEATLRLHGEVAQPLKLEGLDLDLEVELPDVGSLLAAAPVKPGLGAARLRGHLTDPGGEPGLDRIVVEPHPDADLRLRVEGSVRKLADPSGIELDGEIETDQLRFLEHFVERPLPEGRLRVKFQLSDRDGTIGVEGEAHAESRDGSLRVDLSGGFDDLRAVDELDAKLRVAAPALDMIGHTAGLDWELPALGPVTASGRVRARSGSIGVDGLVLDAGRRGETWLSLRGSVKDLQAFRGVALDASVGARSLVALGRALRPERSLPELGPLDLRAKLSDARGPLAVEHFELRGGSPATLAVDLKGKLADIRKIDALELEGRVRARDSAVLGSLLDLELPSVAPLAFEGRARGSDERIESEGSADLGQTRIEGRWSAEIAGKGRPRIVATLRSAHLRLEDIGLGPQRAADASDADQGGSRWSARETLPFEELRRLDARLELGPTA